MEDISSCAQTAKVWLQRGYVITLCKGNLSSLSLFFFKLDILRK